MSDNKYLMQLIVDEVAIGSLTAKEIKLLALDYLIDEENAANDAPTYKRVSDLVDAAFEAHYEKQAQWDAALTDHERLQLAFEELWERGIIAAMNFACCQTCGHGEMEAWLKQSDSQDKLGYTFFHQQDAERMVQNGYVYLAYGSRAQTDKATAAIATEVVEVLQKHGLDASWNGSTKTRIHIGKILWRVRRVKAMDYADG